MVAIWVDSGSGPAPNPALTQAQFNVALAQWQAQNASDFYQAGVALVSSFMDAIAALIVASGVGHGDANALQIVKWVHAIYTFYATNKATVQGWTTPAAVDQSIMNYTSVGGPPVTLLTVATSVIAALNTKYPGQV